MLSNLIGTIILLAGIGILVLIAWQVFGRTEKDSAKPKPDVPRAPTSVDFQWPHLGEYDFEVVGESNYQLALKALHGSATDGDPTGTAVLILEDDNPYDDKAVKVTVQGVTVGYLSREDARSYRRRLGAKKLGRINASCGIKITGGWELADGKRAHYGAQLDMKPFE